MGHCLRLTRCSANFIALGTTSATHAQKNWRTFGHDLAGTRHSTLQPSDSKDFTKLVCVWTDYMDAGAPPLAVATPTPGSSGAGDTVAGTATASRGRGGRGGRGAPGGDGGNSEASPLVIGGMTYMTIGACKVVALAPDSGKDIWAYTWAYTDGKRCSRSGYAGINGI
jgi:quinoprotein glucose dehydrogenase